MKKLIHFLILWLLSIMFLFLIVSFFYPDILLPIIEFIKAKIELLWRWNYLLAFLSALFESLPIIWVIIPGQILLISVGWFYGATSTPALIGVILSAIAGSVVSNAFGYYLGKYYGEDFFKNYGIWVGIEQTELKYLKKWVDTWGPWGIILSKFHPQGRAFLPFIAGSMGFMKTLFWTYNIIASVLWAVVFVLIGLFFAEYYEIIVKYIGYAIMCILLWVFWYFYVFQREKFLAYWQEKNAEMEAKYHKR